MFTRHRWALLLLLALAWPVHAAGPSSSDIPYVERPVTAPGVVRGRIVYAGTPPVRMRLAVTSDFACCGRVPIFSENLLVGPEGGLINAVVHIDDIQSGKPFPRTTATVDQVGCVFVPHLAMGQCRGQVRVVNSDPVFHNVHAYQGGLTYTVFNVALPLAGDVAYRDLPMPGPVVLKCDAGHRWMTGLVWAARNPYVARTLEDGRFVIDGIPAGPHVVQVWHESLGELEVPLDLPASATLEVLIDARRDRTPRLAVTARPRVVPGAARP